MCGKRVVSALLCRTRAHVCRLQGRMMADLRGGGGCGGLCVTACDRKGCEIELLACKAATPATFGRNMLGAPGVRKGVNRKNLAIAYCE